MRELEERVHTGKTAQVRVIDPAVHMNRPQRIQVFMDGKTSCRVAGVPAWLVLGQQRRPVGRISAVPPRVKGQRLDIGTIAIQNRHHTAQMIFQQVGGIRRRHLSGRGQAVSH